MSALTFAGWVEPIAARLRSTRREVAELAREIPEDAWQLPSPVEGWAYRDVLAHLAEGDAYIRLVIKAVLDGADTDLRPQNEQRESRNSAILQRGATRTTDELISSALQDSEETQLLLSQLNDDDETVLVITSRTRPAPIALGACLVDYRHDEEHLAQLREAKMVRS